MIQTIKNETINSGIQIDANGLSTSELNYLLRQATYKDINQINIVNVCGQRYIGTDIHQSVNMNVFGIPGNDLGIFLDGPKINVHGNAQDGCGNTMDNGEIVIHGHAGDITGLSARGGKIFIRDDVGYRAGIHIKEYGEKRPVLVIGGTAQDFLGEYMAGGILVLLGLDLAEWETHQANYIGTGMHGGVIYIRGKVDDFQLGKEVGVAELAEQDYQILNGIVSEFANHFSYDAKKIMQRRFIKLFPLSLRPYGKLYTN
jgi:glutamate synthase domain-containing protein 3